MLSSTTINNLTNALRTDGSSIIAQRNLSMGGNNIIMGTGNISAQKSTIKLQTLNTSLIQVSNVDSLTANGNILFRNKAIFNSFLNTDEVLSASSNKVKIQNVTIEDESITAANISSTSTITSNEINATNISVSNALSSNTIKTSNIDTTGSTLSVLGNGVSCTNLICNNIEPIGSYVNFTKVNVNSELKTTTVRSSGESFINGTTFTTGTIETPTAKHTNLLVDNINKNVGTNVTISSDLNISNNDLQNVKDMTVSRILSSGTGITIDNLFINGESIQSNHSSNKVIINNLETQNIKSAIGGDLSIFFKDNEELNFGTSSISPNVAENNPEIQFVNKAVSINKNGLILRNNNSGGTNFIELSVNSSNRVNLRSFDNNVVLPNIEQVVYDVLIPENNTVLNNALSRCSFRVIEEYVHVNLELNLNVLSNTNVLNFTLPSNYKVNNTERYNSVYIRAPGVTSIDGYVKSSPSSDLQIYYPPGFNTDTTYQINGTAIYEVFQQVFTQPFMYKIMNITNTQNILTENLSRFLSFDSHTMLDLHVIINFRLSNYSNIIQLQHNRPIKDVYQIAFANNGVNLYKIIIHIDTLGNITILNPNENNVLSGDYTINVHISYETKRNSTDSVDNFFFSKIL